MGARTGCHRPRAVFALRLDQEGLGARDGRILGLDSGVREGVERLTGRPGIARHVCRLAPASILVLPLSYPLHQRHPFLDRTVQPFPKDQTERNRLWVVIGLRFGEPFYSLIASLDRLGIATRRGGQQRQRRQRGRTVVRFAEERRPGFGQGQPCPCFGLAAFNRLIKVFNSLCAAASGFGSAPSPRANHAGPGVRNLGVPSGVRSTFEVAVPYAESDTHFVSSANTGSSTAWPRCLASRIDQTTRAVWWHVTQLCSAFQTIASLDRKPSPRV